VYGRIINTTSGAGLHGHFGQTNYSAAKSAIVGLTQTLSLELASIGATVNAISPGGRTRMSASMPGAAAPIEPDERAEDEFDPKDPSLGSPVVAWLASPEAGHVSGQVIRAMGEHVQLLKGWHPVASVSNGEKRWDANTLGTIMATDVFGTRNAGLRLGG
jgi:NAD(P)-dependent dehydrogenase (short-subunit alcohol dehydrogenase family)